MTMKGYNIGIKVKVMVLLMVLSLLNVSCEFEQDNNGFPEKISFPKDGGMQILHGDAKILSLTIHDTYGSVLDFTGPSENDSLIVKYRWLTVKTKWRGKELTVIAEPSTSNEKRELMIKGSFGKKYAEIQVSQ